MHYEPYELKVFEHIECEWPLFFCYMLLDAHMRYDAEMIAEYQAKLQPLLVPRRIDEDTVVKCVAILRSSVVLPIRRLTVLAVAGWCRSFTLFLDPKYGDNSLSLICAHPIKPETCTNVLGLGRS